MILILSIHCGGEEHLDIWFSLVYSWRVNISLTLVLYVALHTFLDFHDHLARKISKQINCLLLPADTSIGLEEMRNVIIGGLRDRTLEDLTAFCSTKVGVILSDIDLVQTGTANYCGLVTFFLG